MWSSFGSWQPRSLTTNSLFITIMLRLLLQQAWSVQALMTQAHHLPLASTSLIPRLRGTMNASSKARFSHWMASLLWVSILINNAAVSVASRCPTLAPTALTNMSNLCTVTHRGRAKRAGQPISTMLMLTQRPRWMKLSRLQPCSLSNKLVLDCSFNPIFYSFQY